MSTPFMSIYTHLIKTFQVMALTWQFFMASGVRIQPTSKYLAQVLIKKGIV